MEKIIIAIDGHSSCGKSTLAKGLAFLLQYKYIDTGAMYRAVTYFLLEKGIDISDGEKVASVLDQVNIRFSIINGQNRTFLNGEDIEDEIRQMHVSKWVSPVSTISAVRKVLVEQQQAMGREAGIVMDGRDIGTVVFPDAQLKIFLTASIQKRTQRRFDELRSKGQEVEAEAVQQNLQERDHIDSNRHDSPLKQAEDAVLIDNTNLDVEEQLRMVLALSELRIKKATL